MENRFAVKILAVTGICSLIQVVNAAVPDPTSWLQSSSIETTSSTVNPKSTLRWIDGKYLTLEGRGFTDTETSYSRLAKKYQGQVTGGVWTNSVSAAGVALRFVTNSPDISVKWGDVKDPMSHMPWTGTSGVDLYALENNKWVFRGIGMPSGVQNEKVLQTGKAMTATEYLLFLPLYSKVDKVEIGIGQTANIAAGTNRYVNNLPIVYYGTSITQGGCASRPGMAHTSILRRWLDHPSINLGFSGSGKCELIMADVLAEISAAIYVVETVANMDAAMVTSRAVPFITALRSKQPDTTILMVESPNAKNNDRNIEWRKAFEQMTADGMTKLHYLTNNEMYNTREEATVDGTHPTDLGFYQIALKYEPALRAILATQNPASVDQFQSYNSK